MLGIFERGYQQVFCTANFHFKMHFTTTLSAACLVALASANAQHAHHFHMRRQLNATVPSTTLTVYATETKTILSCAAIVTDCPAHPEQATSEVVVTVTKAISTVSLDLFVARLRYYF